MRTVADPRILFREIDATDIGSESYEFEVAEEQMADIVGEGEEPGDGIGETRSILVKFDEFDSGEHAQQLAREELQEEAQSQLADSPLPRIATTMTPSSTTVRLVKCT